MSLLTRVVDEELVARQVDLSHHQPASTQPGPVALAERRVLEPTTVLLEILVMQQFERYPRAVALPVNPGAVRLCTLARERHRGVEPALERVVVERLDLLPVERCRESGRDHDADPRDHDADLGDQSADPGDHDAPIRAITMRRSSRS